jgi:hypothetical protein
MWQSEEEVTFVKLQKFEDNFFCTTFLYISKWNLILRNRGFDIQQ